MQVKVRGGSPSARNQRFHVSSFHTLLNDRKFIPILPSHLPIIDFLCFALSVAITSDLMVSAWLVVEPFQFTIAHPVDCLGIWLIRQV